VYFTDLNAYLAGEIYTRFDIVATETLLCYEGDSFQRYCVYVRVVVVSHTKAHIVEEILQAIAIAEFALKMMKVRNFVV